MTIVEDEQLILPRARGRLVRLPCTFAMCTKFKVLLYSYMFLLLIIGQVLCTWAPLLCKEHLGTIGNRWPNTLVMNLVMSPKLENLRNSKFLNISMLMCYSLADHEPSTMYLSNSLLQGITWGHRSRESIGDFLKTITLVLEPLKGR